MAGRRSSFAASGMATLSPRGNSHSRGKFVPESVRQRAPNRAIAENYGTASASEDANRFQGVNLSPRRRSTGQFNDTQDVRIHNALTGVGVQDLKSKPARSRAKFSPRPGQNGNPFTGQGQSPIQAKRMRGLGLASQTRQHHDIRQYNTVIGTGVRQQDVFPNQKKKAGFKPIQERNVLTGTGVSAGSKRARGAGSSSSAAKLSVLERNLLTGTQESSSWWDKTVQPSPRQRNVIRPEEVDESGLWSPRHKRSIRLTAGNPITGEDMDKRLYKPQSLGRGDNAPQQRPFSICSGRDVGDPESDKSFRWTQSPAVVPKLRLSELVS